MDAVIPVVGDPEIAVGAIANTVRPRQHAGPEPDGVRERSVQKVLPDLAVDRDVEVPGFIDGHTDRIRVCEEALDERTRQREHDDPVVLVIGDVDEIVRPDHDAARMEKPGVLTERSEIAAVDVEDLHPIVVLIADEPAVARIANQRVGQIEFSRAATERAPATDGHGARGVGGRNQTGGEKAGGEEQAG